MSERPIEYGVGSEVIFGDLKIASQTKWETAERESNDLVEHLLLLRNIDDQEVFFNPNFERDSHDPFLMPNMDRAIDRIDEAIKKGQPIGIFGDYDADGIPGTALLVKALAACGGKVVTYLPDREKEGYGLNSQGLDWFKSQGVGLVITVDLGIANKEQVEYAKSIGLDVIITDHHKIQDHLLPTNAYAVVHPKLEGSKYPFDGLAGGGVAWKVAQALHERFGRPTVAELKWWLELPAISTTCDIVPMRGENRMIAHWGYRVLRVTKNVGLRAMYKAAGIKSDTINEFTVGFQIGPRINAPGRVAHGAVALELLTTDDPNRAAELAAQIEIQNRERQQHIDQIIDEAEAMVEKMDDLPMAIVLKAENWPQGLIGLAASKISEKYYRPVVLLGRAEDRLLKGSSRGIKGIDLVEGFDSVADLLVKYGGHAAAAGLQLEEANFEEFVHRFNDFIAQKLDGVPLEKVSRADAIIGNDEITEEFVAMLERFAPFGLENPRPKFIIEPLEVVGVKAVGAEGKHLQLRFPNELSAIGFGLGHLAPKIKVGDKLSIFGTLEFNDWNSAGSAETIRRIQIKVSDLKHL